MHFLAQMGDEMIVNKKKRIPTSLSPDRMRFSLFYEFIAFTPSAPSTAVATAMTTFRILLQTEPFILL